VVFLISDLIDDKDFSPSLKQLNRRHDVIAVQIYDPSERNWQSKVSVVVEDAETGELITFDGSRSEALKNEMQKSSDAVAALCRSAKVDRVELESGSDVLSPLIKFFALRSSRKRH
jgi:hypothetical protein